MKDVINQSELISKVQRLGELIPVEVLQKMQEGYRHQKKILKLPSHRRALKKHSEDTDYKLRLLADENFPNSKFLWNSFFDHSILFLLKERAISTCVCCNSRFLGGVNYCSVSCSAKHATQTDEVKARRKATCLKTYGYDNPAKSRKVRSKLKCTLSKRLPTEIQASNQRRERTSLQKYGVQNVSKLDGVKSSIKEAFELNYGSLEKYWEHKAKETAKSNLREYGVTCYLQSEQGKKKTLKTKMAKWGVPNHMQSPKFHSENPGVGYKKWDVMLSDGSIVTVQSKPEEYLAARLCDLGYTVKNPDIAIPYRKYYPGEDQLRTSRYRPEFLVYKGKELKFIVEVKCPYTLKDDLDVNKRKFRAANKYCRLLGIPFVLCVYTSADDGFKSISFPTERKFHTLIKDLLS